MSTSLATKTCDPVASRAQGRNTVRYSREYKYPTVQNRCKPNSLLIGPIYRLTIPRRRSDNWRGVVPVRSISLARRSMLQGESSILLANTAATCRNLTVAAQTGEDILSSIRRVFINFTTRIENTSPIQERIFFRWSFKSAVDRPPPTPHPATRGPRILSNGGIRLFHWLLGLQLFDHDISHCKLAPAGLHEAILQLVSYSLLG